MMPNRQTIIQRFQAKVFSNAPSEVMSRSQALNNLYTQAQQEGKDFSQLRQSTMRAAQSNESTSLIQSIDTELTKVEAALFRFNNQK